MRTQEQRDHENAQRRRKTARRRALYAQLHLVTEVMSESHGPNEERLWKVIKIALSLVCKRGNREQVSEILEDYINAIYMQARGELL